VGMQMSTTCVPTATRDMWGACGRWLVPCTKFWDQHIHHYSLLPPTPPTTMLITTFSITLTAVDAHWHASGSTLRANQYMCGGELHSPVCVPPAAGGGRDQEQRAHTNAGFNCGGCRGREGITRHALQITCHGLACGGAAADGVAAHVQVL
jgi:hypothetical protein